MTDPQTHPRELVRDLRSLVFDGDKDDQWENETDVLEIVAVAVGLKPAHLCGAGTRGSTVQAQLEAIATAHHLHATYTAPITPWFPRASILPPELDEFLAQREDSERRTALPVLWIYQRLEIADLLPDVVTGKASVASVLGYPLCCVTEIAQRNVRIYEELYGHYWRMASGSIAAVEDLISRDVSVDLDIPIHHEGFSPDFPFVQFIPCGHCRQMRSSPGKQVNDAFAALARALDPGLAARITSLARRRKTTA